MMGHLSPWSPQRRRHVAPWARRRTRRWIRANNIGHAGMLLAAIPSLPRAELSRLTERMIDRMDEIDGDPDLEFLREDDEDDHDREMEEAYD